MTERECTFKIVAFVNGERKEIKCDPEKGCLKDLVWSGIGVRAAAIKMLDIQGADDIKAMVVGDCKIIVSSESNSK
ncbi:MAG TPA: hypothetical protein ACFYEK_16305 [Candidatus Wunengus sp. YC60]|uniref:hypothetical protein n=1 Tax=Candidatus Wunengus sp. YC60 TaxID=3367697 RepID=UPI004024E942